MKELLRKVLRWFTVADAPTVSATAGSGQACDLCSRSACYFLSVNKDSSQYCEEHRPLGWFR